MVNTKDTTRTFLLLNKETFQNGIKTGIWKIWNATDKIFVNKDYGNNGIESPIIEKRYLNYPIVLVENRDTLPQGLFILYVTFTENCQLSKLEILKGIDEEFDMEISNRYKRYVSLCNKYEMPIEECTMKKDTLKINFKL